jgi:hypothetical protein
MRECNRIISLVGLSMALALVLIPTVMHDYQVKSKTVSINCSNDKPCQKTVCESSKACSTTIGETFESGTTSDTNSTTLGHQSNR